MEEEREKNRGKWGRGREIKGEYGVGVELEWVYYVRILNSQIYFRIYG